MSKDLNVWNAVRTHDPSASAGEVMAYSESADKRTYEMKLSNQEPMKTAEIKLPI
jgi:hypothetical protein